MSNARADRPVAMLTPASTQPPPPPDRARRRASSGPWDAGQAKSASEGRPRRPVTNLAGEFFMSKSNPVRVEPLALVPTLKYLPPQFPCPHCGAEGFVCIDTRVSWCAECGTVNDDGEVRVPERSRK